MEMYSPVTFPLIRDSHFVSSWRKTRNSVNFLGISKFVVSYTLTDKALMFAKSFRFYQ